MAFETLKHKIQSSFCNILHIINKKHPWQSSQIKFAKCVKILLGKTFKIFSVHFIRQTRHYLLLAPNINFCHNLLSENQDLAFYSCFGGAKPILTLTKSPKRSVNGLNSKFQVFCLFNEDQSFWTRYIQKENYNQFYD